MKLESLKNGKFQLIEKEKLKNLRGQGILSRSTDQSGGLFDVHWRGVTYTGVQTDEMYEDGQGNVTRFRIQCEDGSWQELPV